MPDQQTWFRVDRKGSKWHMTRAIMPGAESARVFVGVCGGGVGDSPEREPRVLVTDTEPSRDRTCHRCAKRGSHG